MIGHMRRVGWGLPLPVFFSLTLLIALTTFLQASPNIFDDLRYISNSQEKITLEPGKPIEKELNPGETHSYAISLTAGQFIQVRVEQIGIDVSVQVVVPGKELIEIDNYNSQSSSEEAFLVAEQSGLLSIRIQSTKSKVPSGKYKITVETLRAAMEQDLAAAKAQQLHIQANLLNDKGKAEDMPTVINTFEEAARLYSVANKPRWVANAWKDAGAVSFKASNPKKAIEFFQQALPLIQANGDQADMAGLLNDMGLTSSRLGDLAKAEEYLQKALLLRRATGNRTGEAITLNNLGLVFSARGDIQKGMALQEQSLALRKELGDEIGVARLLNALGNGYAALGQTQRALEFLKEGYVIRRKLKDKIGEANSLNNLARVYAELGEVDQSVEYYELSLKLYREIGNKSGEAFVLHNLGAIFQGRGEGQKSLNYLQQAAQLWQATGEKAELANTLDFIGYFYQQIGDVQRDIDFTSRALQLRRDIGDKVKEGASLSNLGMIYYDIGEYQKALENFQQSLTLVQAASYKGVIAKVNGNIGLALEKLGKDTEAVERYSRSLAIGQEIENLSIQATALINLGNLNARLNNREKADEQLRQSLTISQAINLKEMEIKSLISLAQNQIALGRLAEAQRYTQLAITLIESFRNSFINLGNRAGYFSKQKPAYDLHLKLLMQMEQREHSKNYAENAFQTAERSKARSLLESLTEARSTLRQGIDPVLLNRERALQHRLSLKAAEQTNLLSGKHTQAQATKLAEELSSLTLEYEQLQTGIRQQSPHYVALTQPQPLATSQIKKEVVASNDTLLLEYALGEEESFLWTISANSFNSYKLPKGEVIEKAAQRVYDLLTDRNKTLEYEDAEESLVRHKKADADFPAAAAELSQMILAPIADELRAKRPKQLLIVADGKLQYVPFAALPLVGKNARANRPPTTGYRPLISDYEIVNLPSASTLAVLRRELKDRKPAPKTVAVFADPVFDAADDRLSQDVRDRLAREQQTPTPEKAKLAEAAIAESDLTRAIRNVGLDGTRGELRRLKYSRDEANAILQLVPVNERFSAMDFDANQDAALKPDLSQYRYVHFATHGFLDNQTPELSGLVLSQLDSNGNKLDGYLRMVEIVNLNLPAELVVLSACKTGIGKEVRGEGLMSLTRGFLYAGAKRVMVSLWNVDDKSTSVLMGEMYGHLLSTTPEQKLRPSAALRAAQLKMLRSKQWAAPYYWAAFVQLGEPR